MNRKTWSTKELTQAVKSSTSYRQIITKLGLVPAGGNYTHVQRIIKELGLPTTHLKGKGWNTGTRTRTPISLEKLLVKNSSFQSFKLKKRLFKENIKSEKCEKCGWCKKTSDGRIPVELDHINGDKTDNRLENLRILCPNCHSLEPTHRGLNKQKPGW